ncbi:putative all-trans-retinol 13,14-reductase [Symbiodinium microadriaticum]|uniref:Putative all-trans-retinol 13,14-reductase n=1 Tax=Symbiodinium microadriaticum TaxID=2951 RepID=A0A1Q9CTB3_SYMMI|nr:putative all-trans-retinol 13,14-reductase [Symbiodinium microadriaticum]
MNVSNVPERENMFGQENLSAKSRRSLAEDLPEEADAVVIGAGYDFETGFHYAGEMRKGQELRAIVDSLTNDETGPERIYDKVVFSDGDKFGVPSGIKNWLNALQEKFPEERDAIDVYARDLKATQTSFFPMMIWRSIPSEWLSYLDAYESRSREGPFPPFLLHSERKLYNLLAAPNLHLCMLAGKKMQELTRHPSCSKGPMIMGSRGTHRMSVSKRQGPQSSVMLTVRSMLGLHLHFGEGAYFPVGGPSKMASAMVKQIERQAKDGLTIRAPVVVSTIGLHGTEKFLQDQPCHEEELNLPRHNTWMLPGEDPSYKEFYPDQSTCAIVAGDIPWEWFEKWNGTRVHHRGQDYEDLKKRYELRLMDMLYTQFPQVRGRVQYVSLGTPLDTNFFLGKSYGLQQTLAKTWADTNWLFAKPIIQRWPDGLFLAGQDVTSDGFAPSVVSAILAACAIAACHKLEVADSCGAVNDIIAIIIVITIIIIIIVVMLDSDDFNLIITAVSSTLSASSLALPIRGVITILFICVFSTIDCSITTGSTTITAVAIVIRSSDDTPFISMHESGERLGLWGTLKALLSSRVRSVELTSEDSIHRTCGGGRSHGLSGQSAEQCLETECSGAEVWCWSALHHAGLAVRESWEDVDGLDTTESDHNDRVYEDTLVDPAGGAIYIGEFVGEVPHGRGCSWAFAGLELKEVLCEPQGCDFAAFSRLIDDDSDDGLYCEDAELADMLNQLLMSGVGIPAGRAPAKAALGEAVPAGLEYFVREREAGLYDGEWKAWDPNEGIKARTPRVGKIGTLDGCPSTADVQEALMFVNEQVQEGIFGDASTQAQERLGELLALQGSAAKGAGWFEFRLDENVMDEEQLSEMVLAPRGWQVDRSTVPTGYMMHIMSVGNGVKATLCGREGLHIVNSLHRDVSKCKRLCDTGLCGVVGRKRVIVFPPDAFPSSTTVLRSPDMTCDMLRPLCDMPEEEAWSRLEEMAQQPGSKGGVVDLEPGMFFFIPHGWWHAVRPIDDFTFITGPSQLSGLGVATV